MTAQIAYPVPDEYINAISQFFGENLGDYPDMKGHNGVDWAVPELTKLKAVAMGDVLQINLNKFGYGRNLKLRLTDGTVVMYAHLHETLVRVGERVQMGQEIALSGGRPGDEYAGNTTGPHLHFGVYPQGVSASNGYGGAVDPLSFTSKIVAVLPEILTPATNPIFHAVITWPAGANVRSRPNALDNRNIIGSLPMGTAVGIYDFASPVIMARIHETKDHFIALAYEGKPRVSYG